MQPAYSVPEELKVKILCIVQSVRISSAADIQDDAGINALAVFSDSCGRLIACCISDAAAVPLSGLPFKAVRIASHPDQESLLALLG